jgi:hypothetical protein
LKNDGRQTTIKGWDLKSVTGGLKEQRESGNSHQKAVTKIEGKLLIERRNERLNFGGY